MNAIGDETPAGKRLAAPGKKCILTLDGGGVRGIVSIAFLAEMECQLRKATDRRDLVLSDVFDFVAGTSVGSMLATMIALGKPIEDIEAEFRQLAPRIFSGRMTRLGQRRFDEKPLIEGVRRIVGEERLDSGLLRTGLAIIAKRVNTDSVWVLTNNPAMPYFNDGATWDGNRRYRLDALIRASTAAPFLFAPTEITIHTDRFGKTDKGLFVDGGVSPHNNPSLLMLMMAALPAYQLNWALSQDDLLMISVGTGTFRSPVTRDGGKLLPAWLRLLMRRNLADDVEEAAFAAKTLQSLISNNDALTLKMMQALSHPRFSWQINSEIGSLHGQILQDAVIGMRGLHKDRCALRFQRYDLPLEARGLVPAQYDVDATQEERRALQPLDQPANIDKLYLLAREAARKQVRMIDFHGFL